MLTALLAVPSALLALLLYGLHLLILSLASALTLPRHRPLSTARSPSPLPFIAHWKILWQPPWIYSIWTTAFNGVPTLILSKLKFRNSQRLKKFYNFSIGLGLVGMAVGVLGAGWVSAGVCKELWAELEGHAGSTLDIEGEVMDGVGENLVARGMSDSVPAESTSGNGFQPLIPGLTVPLSHLPALLFALLFNQLIHELGHALSAALDDVQPSKLSLNLHYFLPSMTVEFPPSVDSLDPNAKMRIATSGPAINFTTWAILWLLASSGIGALFWQDRAKEGVVVQDVQWSSPLSAHLQVDDTISHLDDIPMTNVVWRSYLNSDEPDDPTRGWCVDKDTFLAIPDGPCNSTWHSGNIPFLSIELHSPYAERCLAPHPVLDISSAGACPDHRWVMVRPVADDILRIRISKRGKDEVVIWEGPREEVLRSVKVGIKGARGWAGGVWAFTILYRYIKTIAFSLFLFNLLPIPTTDGAQLLESLLEWKPDQQQSLGITSLKATREKAFNSDKPGAAEEYELGSGDEEGGEGNYPAPPQIAVSGGGLSQKWKKGLKLAVQAYVVLVCFICLAGWSLIALLRSS